VRLALLVLLVPLLGTCGQGTQSVFTELRYHVSGGVAGFDRSLILAKKGGYQVDEPGESSRYGRLSNQRMRLLNDKVRQIDWASLDARYAGERLADVLYEELTIMTASHRYSVTIGTGGNAPEALVELAALLRQVAIEDPS